MKIFEIIHDIIEDIDIRNSRVNDVAPSHSWRRRNGNAGFYLTILPNIVGFIVGCAVARLFILSGIFYLILGIIFAVAGGTYFSVTKEGIALKYAIIRHCLIVGFVGVLFVIAFLSDEKNSF